MTKKTITIKKLVRCARCGANHVNLRFKRFRRKAGKNTHWCPCPKTKEPILLRMSR